jgi:hypothetical protein
MLPAAMQRPYVWTKGDVEALCDSVMTGFPIGGFTMWAPGEKADLKKVSKGRLGPIGPAAQQNVNAFNPMCLLLDGQNRLATIAWMIASADGLMVVDPSPEEKETWLGDETLVLDYETRSLRFVPKSEAEVGLRLPGWMAVSMASHELNSRANKLTRDLCYDVWIPVYGEEKAYDFLKFWDHARDKFKDARTAETVIEDATPEEALNAFLRICKVGVPMSEDDFKRATNWNMES